MTWNIKGWQGKDSSNIEPAYLGNGVFGLRFGGNPFDYGRLIIGGLWGYHGAEDIHRIVDVPSPLHFDIRLGAGRAVRRPARVEPASQQLDYLTATLVSDGILYNSDGEKAQYHVKHWISRALPSLAVMELTIIPEKTMTVTIRPRQLGEAAVAGCVKVATEVPGRWDTPGESRIIWQAAGGADKGVVLLSVREANGAQVQAVSGCFSACGDEMQISWPDAAAGQPLKLRLYMTVVSTAHHPQPEAQAVRMRRWAFSHSHAELRAAHLTAWAEIWRGRVIVDGDDEAQAAVDGSLFHLFCSASPAGVSGMAPFGLSSDGYSGHVFWDCETWTLPPFMLLDPATARSVLDFRLRGLDAAKAYAALYGYKGAMFPWEADGRGMESTPVAALTGVMQHHVTPDVAFAFWQYQVNCGDEDWLREATWPVLRNVADWICSRVDKTARGYEIRHVIGADEFSQNVHNNAFTNLICRKVLGLADECCRRLGGTPPAQWGIVADGIYIPRDAKSGLILQQDGWTPEKISKQADTVLAVYPSNVLERQDIEKVIAAHVPLDPEHACMVAMGDQLHAVAAARIGRRDLAKLFFRRGWQPYWIKEWGMFSETISRRGGCFITGHGGVLQAALMGFPGLQLDDPQLAIHPVALPEGWQKITCERIYVHGKPLRMEAVHGKPAELQKTT